MSSLGLIRAQHLNIWDIGNYYGLTQLGVDLYVCGTGPDVNWDGIMEMYPMVKPVAYEQPWEVLELELDVLDLPDAHYDFTQWFIGRHPKTVVVAWDNLPGKNTMRPKALEALQGCWKCVGRSELACQTLEFDGVPQEKIKLIYGAVDTDFFQPTPLEDRTNAVLFVGRLILEKGLLDLMWAMEGIDAPLWIVGEGERSAFDFWANRNPNIEFMGFVDRYRLRELYQSARLFCVPSVPKSSHNPDEAWLEQFAQIMPESMACGTPIVSTLSGAINEVAGFQTGFLVAPRDWAGIRDSVELLLRDNNVWDEFSLNAHKRAENLFSQKVIAGQIRDWYEI